MELRNKRGMFFTLIAIALLSLLMISITIYSVAKERDSLNKRISTMNNYVFSFEEDLSRKLFISGFRIIFLYNKRIADTGIYISDVNASFNEAFFYGTFNGEPLDPALIEGVIFSDIEKDLNEDAGEIGVQVNLSNPVITLDQTDPWNVRVVLNINFFVEDLGGLASWNRTSDFIAYIPINNFEDPIYLENSNGLITHKIIQTPYENFTAPGDVSNLTDHINNFYYRANNDSPSFLNRLEGDLSADDNGVESLVNIDVLNEAVPVVYDKVIVDHIYFSNDNPSGNTISGMESWVKLDSEHMTIYNN